MAEKKKQVAKKETKTKENSKKTSTKNVSTKKTASTKSQTNSNKINKTTKPTTASKDKMTKAKQKAVEKSRQANNKEKSSKQKKREATRVIPVDNILETQKKAKKKALNKAKAEKKETKDIQKSDNNKNKLTLKFKKDNKNKKTKKTKKNFKLTVPSFLASDKMKKVYIGIVVFCVIVLIIEGIYFLIIRDRINRPTYYDSLNALTLDKTDIVAVGSSYFKNSKFNKYTDEIEKAKLVKYDQTGKILFEKKYSKGIASTFNSVIEVEDGYVAVGSYEKDKQQAKDGLRDALIVKYDKEGKLVWEKNFTSLSNSKFNKVIAVEDGYIVIGQSIYATMEMGNSTEGGGVIIKYSKDGEIIWKKFHGGTKSASFNGITIVDGNFYIIGRDGTDFGNLIKYNKDGEYQWHKNYRYTDTLGLSDIVYSNGKLYAVGAKKVFDREVTDDDKRNTTNTDAVLIRYNLDGEIEFEKAFGGSSYERYNSIMSYHNNLFAIGSSSSSDSGLKIFTDGVKTAGILVKYDKEGNIERKIVYGGSNQDNLTDIVTDNSNLYITAYTNSKDGNIITSKDNGRDYFGRLIKVDSRLRILYLK